jgi:hypothetical protein
MKKILTAIIIVLILAGCNGGKPVQSGEQSQGYIFDYNGVAISVHTPAESVIEALGEPLDYFEAESCAFEGLDKTYYYSGFELTTYPDGETDYIASVYFQDDSVSTKEGICIGSSLEDVLEAYGNDYSGGDSTYVYTEDQGSLIFVVQDGEVISITYQALIDN